MNRIRFLLPLSLIAFALLRLASGFGFHAPTHDLGLAPADLTVFGAAFLDRTGTAVAAGDFNGDGFNDLLVGADEAGAGTGKAYVIFGSPVLSGTRDLAAGQDLIVLGHGSDRLGAAVDAGDFNGDGIDDLLIGAFDADGAGNAKPASGEAYVIFGSPGLGGTKDTATSDEDLTVLGADAGDMLGISVAAGDVNGDAIDDLLLGAFNADGTANAKANAGEIYVIFGSTTLGGTKDIAANSQNLTVLGADAGDALGESVGAGDVNGDAIDDLLMGAFEADAAANAKPGAGEAYVVFGSPTLGGSKDLAASAQNLTVLGADAGDNLGVRVNAGDLNGDGIDDIISGAFFADGAGNAKPDAGEAYVIFGSASLSGTRDIAANPQNLTVIGADAGDRLGLAAAAGDINGDGTDDLLVSADLADAAGNAKPDAGEAYAIFGSATLSGTRDIATNSQNFTVLAADAADQLAAPLAAGDVNSDGIDDLLLGAAEADAAGNAKSKAGEAYVIFGRCPSGTSDFDRDGLCNPFDPDDDDDGIADGSDPCPASFEDFDGFHDDGCADPDNDLDGICDAGQTSASCTGSDSGRTAFYPPGHNHANPTIDCRNIAEEYDSFKDTDGCPEPDNDNDGKPDSNDTCPGNDNLMGPDAALGVGGDNNHNGLVDGGETWAPLGTSGNDDSVRTYEDYDGILDTDGCHDSPCDDVDGDSFGAVIGLCKLFADEREAQLGTNSLRACAATATPEDEAMDPYPLDTNDDGFTDISDIVSITGRFGEAQTPANVRYELNLDGFIDISDIVLMTARFGEACVPPGPFG